MGTSRVGDETAAARAPRLEDPCDFLSYPAPNVHGMLSAADLAVRPDFAVRAVRCRGDHARWSPPELRRSHGVVLVRRGRFRRQAAGTLADIDPTLGYASAPGLEERFAHPAGGDVCTSLTMSPQLWNRLVGAASAPARPLYVDARLDLAHRRLLAAARTRDADFGVAEELLRLLAAAMRRPGPWGPARVADRPLVSAARDAIRAGHPSAGGLFSLAEALGASPYRLSRAFSSELGVSLTRYRNRVRVGRALDRLEAGEKRLAVLAADLGFADQAHLCHTIREHAGHSPSALRGMLGLGQHGAGPPS